MTAYSEDLRVVYGTVGVVADEIHQGRVKVEQQIEELWDAVQKVSGAWEGEAKESFGVVKVQWDARAHHIKTVLTDMETKVRGGVDQYQATDRKAASLFENYVV